MKSISELSIYFYFCTYYYYHFIIICRIKTSKISNVCVCMHKMIYHPSIWHIHTHSQIHIQAERKRERERKNGNLKCETTNRQQRIECIEWIYYELYLIFIYVCVCLCVYVCSKRIYILTRRTKQRKADFKNWWANVFAWAVSVHMCMEWLLSEITTSHGNHIYHDNNF